MDQPPPVPLEYRGRGDPPPPNPNAAKHFAWGLFGGIGVSALAYFGGGALNRDSILFLGLLIAFVKAVVGITCVCIRRRRAFGAGVLTSLPVGFAIFFGACAAFFNGH
jgi:hypothetical protein